MTGKVIAVLIAAGLVAAAPALAEQVGTATAVNPVSEGTPPGGAPGKLTVGARVMRNEHIHTSPSGSAQLLFLDKSSLNIAPNTSLVINEFVYDPAANSGHMLSRLTAGTLQYIGGQLSHQGAVTINTPAVAVGIRGGTVTIIHGANGTQIINQYGTITLTNAAGTTVVTRPGFTVTIANWKTPPGSPTQVTADEVRRNIKNLSSTFGQDGGVRGLQQTGHGQIELRRPFDGGLSASAVAVDGRKRRHPDYRSIDPTGDPADPAAAGDTRRLK